MKPLSNNEYQTLCKQYPQRTRVKLLEMDDSQAPPIGTEGTVLSIDSLGSIKVKWDNGSTLRVLYGIDKIQKL